MIYEEFILLLNHTVLHLLQLAGLLKMVLLKLSFVALGFSASRWKLL